MGMVACFSAADAATLDQLKADPYRMEEFLYPDDGEGEPPHCQDIDKSWHCIHFMLAGSTDVSAEPLSWAILGGEEIGDDVGYGPARILEPQQVQSIAAALSKIDEATFKAKFNPKAMQAANVYLSEMCVRDGEEAFEYLLENYRILLAFYQSAAARGDGAILWLS